MSIIDHPLKPALLPAKLLTTIAHLPNGPGVYLFYCAQSSIPLYIGKSVNLRQRVRSHYHCAHLNSKELKITQQTQRIEVIETAGELSALLLESRLIKEMMPVYNYRLRRRKKIVGFKSTDKNGYLTIECTSQDTTNTDPILGSFNSLTSAKSSLIELVKTFKLCPKLCLLEKASGACFAFQLHRCQGACVGQEPIEDYNARVNQALAKFKHLSWPYPGAIAIREHNSRLPLTEWLIFNHWRHIATVDDPLQYQRSTPGSNRYDTDRDSYYILRQCLTKQAVLDNLIMLN